MTDDAHVIPLIGWRSHVERRDCWCRPMQLIDDAGSVIISHGAPASAVAEAAAQITALEGKLAALQARNVSLLAAIADALASEIAAGAHMAGE